MSWYGLAFINKENGTIGFLASAMENDVYDIVKLKDVRKNKNRIITQPSMDAIQRWICSNTNAIHVSWPDFWLGPYPVMIPFDDDIDNTAYNKLKERIYETIPDELVGKVCKKFPELSISNDDLIIKMLENLITEYNWGDD